MEEELIRLDTRLIYLEDTVSQLNRIIMDQDGQIEQLKRTVNELRNKVRELDEKKGENQSFSDQEKPPHY